jgi:hypothetical protein
MKENLKKERDKVMGYLFKMINTHLTRENGLMTAEKDMEKCNGMMEADIKANGIKIDFRMGHMCSLMVLNMLENLTLKTVS